MRFHVLAADIVVLFIANDEAAPPRNYYRAGN